MAARFKVWVGDTPETTDTLSYRLVPTNCRRQDRGVGAAQFSILREEQVAYPAEFAAVYPNGETIEVNKIIRVEDTQHPGADLYDRTIWCGFITSVIKTPHLGSSEFVGTAYADEIGVYYEQLITDPRWQYKDQNDRFLQSPPDFNPLYNGRYYPNKVNGFLQFIEAPTAQANTLSATTWDVDKQVNVWTIYDIIELTVNGIPNLSFTVPTSSDPEYIEYCDDRVNIKTFPSFVNKPLSEILGQLLPKPLTWRFDYQTNAISQGVVELVIESESEVVIDKIPANRTIISPLVLPNISGADHGIQAFTINEVSIPTDEVVVRGKEILVCGSLTPWDALSKATMWSGWTNAEELAFEAALSTDTSIDPTSEAHDEYRKSLPDVYQKFNFLGGLNGYNARIFTTDLPGSTENLGGGLKYYSFFPEFEFGTAPTSAGETTWYDAPLALKDLSVSSSYYSTPNSLATNWENELPIYREFNFYDAQLETNSLSDSEIRLKPMVWAPVRPDATKDIFWINLLDTSLENKCQLDYHTDGFYVLSQYPQYSAWVDPNDAIFTGEDENVYKSQVITDLWDSESPGKNPADENVQVNSKTHWSRFIFTVAGRSDKKIEYVKRRYDNSNPAQVKKRKIIDTNYENWFVHAGTVVNPYQNTDGSYSLLNRIPQDTWTKNEFPDLVQYGEALFNWLSKKRQSFTVEYQMMNYQYGMANGLDRLKINAYVGSVIDRGVTGPSQNWLCNSVIKSVEYIFNETTPIIIISSELPQEPLFTKLLGENNAE